MTNIAMKDVSIKSKTGKTDVLEKGKIYFFYRPAVNEKSPQGLADIQRFHFVLHPEKKQEYRLFTIGKKKLPEMLNGKDRFWGFVEKITTKAEDIKSELKGGKYETKTLGEREQPKARPAGEGVYAIADHEGHTHLAYWLELPEKKDAVQETLSIEPKGSYILNIKNPQASSPHGVGLPPEEKADYPEGIQKRFEGRRFNPANPPELLDYEKIEILLIGAKKEVEKELGLILDESEEEKHKADIFEDLKIEKDKETVGPLFKGKWK